MLGTGALALLIGATVLTLSELAAGGAVGNSNRSTTLLSRDRERSTPTDEAGQDRPQSTEQPAPDTDATIQDPTVPDTTTTEPPTVTTTPPEQPTVTTPAPTAPQGEQP